MCSFRSLGLLWTSWRSASMIVSVISLTCPLHCIWLVIINKSVITKVRHTCWKNLDVKVDQLLDKSHFSGPYNNSQLATKCFAIVSADIFMREIVFPGLKNRSLITNRIQFFSLVSSSWPKLSITSRPGGGVAGHSCMPFAIPAEGNPILGTSDTICRMAWKSTGMFGPKQLIRKNW